MIGWAVMALLASLVLAAVGTGFRPTGGTVRHRRPRPDDPGWSRALDRRAHPGCHPVRHPDRHAGCPDHLVRPPAGARVHRLPGGRGPTGRVPHRREGWRRPPPTWRPFVGRADPAGRRCHPAHRTDRRGLWPDSSGRERVALQAFRAARSEPRPPATPLPAPPTPVPAGEQPAPELPTDESREA